ncbi:hypothetical protein SISNIDRAFT_310694 [Sistotremastrum niveocremeum HHB9708]|uniref:Uncharacterized protein n=1 Tax=Sistotremastrum niveocremeum HHB9708 TaxID=1314777 RepID=A0A164XVU8_9AGAM|nr:hypothetical protein SISNIDRAFT_310694 [Sistotremastrum niveocremeum HHB9708]
MNHPSNMAPFLVFPQTRSPLHKSFLSPPLLCLSLLLLGDVFGPWHHMDSSATQGIRVKIQNPDPDCQELCLSTKDRDIVQPYYLDSDKGS